MAQVGKGPKRLLNNRLSRRFRYRVTVSTLYDLPVELTDKFFFASEDDIERQFDWAIDAQLLTDVFDS